MEPRLVAILDRYILDVANTKYALSLLPADGLALAVPGTGRTLGDVVDHVVATLEPASVGSSKRAGEPGARLDAALATLVSHCRSHAAEVDLDRLEAGSRHLAMHGLDIIAAAPQIRFDPLVLNWLLYADYTGAPVREAQQQTLLLALRDRYPDPEGESDAS